MATRPCVVLITEATTVIGRAIAVAVARRGVTLALHAQPKTSDDDVDALLLVLSSVMNDAAPRPEVFRVDVTTGNGCDDLFQRVVARFGRIDCLVNNPSTQEDTAQKMDLRTISYEDFVAQSRAVFDTTATTAAFLTFLAFKHMQGHTADDGTPDGATGCRGRVLNVTSRAAFRSDPDLAVFCSAQAAANLLGQNMARSTGGDRVAYFSLAATVVRAAGANVDKGTPNDGDSVLLGQHPHGRLPSSDEVGAAAVFLVLDAPLSMSGTTIDVNGASHIHH